MRKIILTLSLIIIMTLGNHLNAQHDGFFNSTNSGPFEYRSGDGECKHVPQMPSIFDDDFIGDQSAHAPIGNSLLILSSLGAAYLIKKKKTRNQ